MVARRIECIERALEQMFRRVLRACEGEPPQLKEVRVTRDDRNYGMRLRARFGVQGQPDYYTESLLNERDWQDEIRATMRGIPQERAFFYDAGILWSRLYEDHYINRMRQAAARQAIAAGMNGANAFEVHNRLEEIDRLTQHMRANHSDVMSGRLNQRPTIAQYRYDDFEPILQSPNMTATEVRVRRDEYLRNASQALARQTEEHMMRTLGIDPNAHTSTTGDSDGSTLTIETLRQAARALAQNSQHDTWREAFVRSPADTHVDGIGLRAYDHVLYGGAMWFVTPNIEVGTKEAQERGISLLKENLTPEQLKDYETHKRFDVKGGASGKTYRIKHGRQMNIDVLDKAGNRDYRLCFLPVGGLVAGDCMLAQKTALELYETEALKIANRF